MTALLRQLALSSRDDVMAALQYLVAENEVLRAKAPNKLRTTPEERYRLQRFARQLPRSLDDVISIAQPQTVRYWNRPSAGKRKKSGRPLTHAQLVELIIRLSEKGTRGAKRIHGELQKLNLAKRVSVVTIRKILRRQGIPPLGTGTERWKEFRARHPDSMWATDFFTVPVHSAKGRRDAYVMAWIHIPSRRIWCSTPTWYPITSWVDQQARNWQMHAEDEGLLSTAVISDRDTKYGPAFRRILKDLKQELWRIPPRHPHCNGHCERFIGSIKRELMERMLFHDIDQVDEAVRSYVKWYHAERPHQGIDNHVPTPDPQRACDWVDGLTADDLDQRSDIVQRDHYRGVLTSYHWTDAAELKSAA